MIHLHCDEVIGEPETSYKGHGPVFAGECNRIGETLGLSRVRPAKKRGKDRDLPSCAQWPENVRPAGFYLGALAEVPDADGKDEEASPEPVPPESDT
jgi:hypothetical protein